MSGMAVFVVKKCMCPTNWADPTTYTVPLKMKGTCKRQTPIKIMHEATSQTRLLKSQHGECGRKTRAGQRAPQYLA